MNRPNRLYTIKGEDIMQMTLDILEEMNPLESRDKDMLIGIKPNLVSPSKASQGATTHPEIVEGIILYLKNKGFKHIIILESSWVGAQTKHVADYCGYTQLCQKHNIPFVDVKDGKSVKRNAKGMHLLVSEYVQQVDYLINVPLIKGHCQTDITCALKNMKGLIPDSEKRRFHGMGLHKPIAHLNTVIKQDLIIADAICPDPYSEDGGRPRKMDMLVGAYDPVLMDSYAAKVLGYEPLRIGYIKIAHELGLGRLQDEKTEMIAIGRHEKIDSVQQEQKKHLYIISQDNACSACYNHLVWAVDELHREGLTTKFSQQICIGQGYRGLKGKIGIGECTADFENHIEGCPSKKEEILKFLKTMIKQDKI